MSGIRILGPESNAVLNAVLIVAELVGVEVEHVIVEHKDSTTKEFAKKYPLGQIPILLTPEDEQIVTAPAILRYISRAGGNLIGKGSLQETKIDMFVELALGNLQRSSDDITASIFGYREYDEKAVKNSKRLFEKSLNFINDTLKIDVYLVGQRISIADIALVVILHKTLHYAPDDKLAQDNPHAIRHLKYFSSIPGIAKYLSRVVNVPVAPKKPVVAENKSASEPAATQKK